MGGENSVWDLLTICTFKKNTILTPKTFALPQAVSGLNMALYTINAVENILNIFLV